MLWKAAPVDSHGTQLGYIDSGAPNSPIYTTIVLQCDLKTLPPNNIIAVFSRLVPVAQEQNIRVIALNRRDYVNSTPFSEAELAVLSGDDEGAHEEFLRARGLEIAKFLCWIIKELNIPRANVDKTSGGLALLGWSLGNFTTLAFLAHLATYPQEVVQTLEPYLTTFIIHAVPYNFYGYPHPPGTYHPFYVPDNPMHVSPSSFAPWVSAYYKHPAFTEARTLSSLTPDSLHQYTPEQPYRPHTTDVMSQDELSETLDLVPDGRSERLFLDMTPSFQHRMVERALLDVGTLMLPSLKVYFTFCLEDVWLVPWAGCEFERDLGKWKEAGQKTRPIQIVPVAGANHFLHWDDPSSFLKLVTGCIHPPLKQTDKV